MRLVSINNRYNLYDSEFLGYMNHDLLQLDVPGVEPAPIPFNLVRGMFEA